MKLKVLLLPFSLVVLVGSGRQAEAITDADREVMEQMSTMVCVLSVQLWRLRVMKSALLTGPGRQ